MKPDSDLSNYTLAELVQDVRQWNNSDIRNIDDISPNLAMLRARRRVINEILRRIPKD